MAATAIPEKYKKTVLAYKAWGREVKVTMVASKYANNGRLRIDLMSVPDATGFSEPEATLTMNLHEDDPGEDAFFVKLYLENAPLEQLLKSGIFEEVDHGAENAWRFVP